MVSRCACITIGDLETAAGIGRDHEARFAFWVAFAPLKESAFAAATAELHRRIDAKLGSFRLPGAKQSTRKERK